MRLTQPADRVGARVATRSDPPQVATAAPPGTGPAPPGTGPAPPGTDPPPLVLTGERTLPRIAHENYWFRRHEAAYLALAPFVRGARVLEAGCGEGYGADLLARTAHRVVAVDADPVAAAHAGRRYPRVSAVRADLNRQPARDGGFEVVSCLQLIEHLADQAGFIDECARILRPAGTLLLTTPNRLTFSPGDLPPLNPFHTREFAPEELAALLRPRFDVVRMHGLRHGPGLVRWERRHGDLVAAQQAGHPRTWPPHLHRMVARIRARDFAIDRTEPRTALDLVVVAIRR